MIVVALVILPAVALSARVELASVSLVVAYCSPRVSPKFHCESTVVV